MAVTANGSGSQACTVTTEHSVNTVNSAGAYQFIVDLNAAVDGDVFELRIKQMTLTSGTARVLVLAIYYGAQPTDDKIKASMPILNELTDSGSLDFTIKQTFGTSRTIPWKVLKVA